MTEKIPYAWSEFLGDSEISKVPVESMLTSLWGISHRIHSTYAAISKNQAQKYATSIMVTGVGDEMCW